MRRPRKLRSSAGKSEENDSGLEDDGGAGTGASVDAACDCLRKLDRLNPRCPLPAFSKMDGSDGRREEGAVGPASSERRLSMGDRLGSTVSPFPSSEGGAETGSTADSPAVICNALLRARKLLRRLD